MTTFLSAVLCRRAVLLICVLLVMAGAIAVTTAAFLTSSKTSPKPVVTGAPIKSAALNATATPTRSSANIEAELITVTDHGFEPREISRPKGSVLLMIQNRSGLHAVAIQLKREAGPNLRALHLPREQPNWDDVIDLEPGGYVLTEADHPGWLCRITITAQ